MKCFEIPAVIRVWAEDQGQAEAEAGRFADELHRSSDTPSVILGNGTIRDVTEEME